MRFSAKRLIGLSAVAIALVVGLVAPAQALPNNRVELIRGQGSDSTFDVMQKLDRHFNNTAGCAVVPPPGTVRLDHQCQVSGPPFNGENFDHDVAMSFFPLGSSNGINMLNQQGNPGIARIDYARSSRARRVSDNAALRFVAYARDAVPWVNFRDEAGSPAAGVSNLTQAQLKDIFLNCNAAADNWNEVGGSVNAPIIVWTSQQGSGERATFDEFLGGSSETCIPSQYKDLDLANGNRVIFENDPGPIRDCAIDPPGTPGPSCTGAEDLASIYHMGFGAYQAFETGPLGKAEGADLGSIDGVAPSAATILDSSFPYSRFIYNVYRNSYPSNNVTPSALDYMGEKGWICKANTDHILNPKTGVNYGEEIEDIISDTGFVPIPLGPIGGSVVGDSKCRVS